MWSNEHALSCGLDSSLAKLHGCIVAIMVPNACATLAKSGACGHISGKPRSTSPEGGTTDTKDSPVLDRPVQLLLVDYSNRY